MSIINLDQVIISGIREGNQTYEDLLFERFLGIEQFYDADQEEKFSLYVDTITDVILNIRKDENLQINNLKAYVKGILRNKFTKLIKQRQKDRSVYARFEKETIEQIASEEIPASLLEESDEDRLKSAIKEILEKLSVRCREIFKARFVDNLKFSDIASKFDYASENSAKNANHDCLKTARQKGRTIIKGYYEE